MNAKEKNILTKDNQYYKNIKISKMKKKNTIKYNHIKLKILINIRFIEIISLIKSIS
jgi:hypothetical protein